MTLQERFASLTPEQREQFKAVKTAEQLDVFITESKLEISDGEKAQILEYIDKGVLPLADEELENVTGGGMCLFPCQFVKATPESSYMNHAMGVRYVKCKYAKTAWCITTCGCYDLWCTDGHHDASGIKCKHVQ